MANSFVALSVLFLVVGVLASDGIVAPESQDLDSKDTESKNKYFDITEFDDDQPMGFLDSAEDNQAAQDVMNKKSDNFVLKVYPVIFVCLAISFAVSCCTTPGQTVRTILRRRILRTFTRRNLSPTKYQQIQTRQFQQLHDAQANQNQAPPMYYTHPNQNRQVHHYLHINPVLTNPFQQAGGFAQQHHQQQQQQPPFAQFVFPTSSTV